MKRRRLPPMRLAVPVYDGPKSPDPLGRAAAQLLRNAEVQTARGARQNQELSIRLSACYHRNVFASGWLQPEMWIEGSQNVADRSDFSGPRHHGMPERDFLLQGDYEGIGVSWSLAERLLERDDRDRLRIERAEDVENARRLLQDADVMKLFAR